MGFQKWTKRCMPAVQTEIYTTDSGGGQENIKRAHFQACLWKATLDKEPPNLDPLKFGWVKDDLVKSLCAVPIQHDVPLALAKFLKTIQCMCSSDQPCSSLICGCVSGQLLAPYYVVGLTVAVIK